MEEHGYQVFHMTSEAQIPGLVRILYRNHRGEESWRTITPRGIWWGRTKWHAHYQWMLYAYDLEREAERDFAILDVKKWEAVAPKLDIHGDK